MEYIGNKKVSKITKEDIEKFVRHRLNEVEPVSVQGRFSHKELQIENNPSQREIEKDTAALQKEVRLVFSQQRRRAVQKQLAEKIQDNLQESRS